MQKLARFLALGLVLGVASLPSSAAGAQPDPQSLAVLARQTLASEYSVLVGGADQSLVASVDEFGAPRSGAEQLAFTKARREFNAQFGLRYVRFDVQIVPMDVSARGGDLELVAEERTTLYFINSMRAHDPLRDLTRSRRMHTFTFAGPAWTVTLDTAELLATSPGGATSDPGTTIRGGSAPAPRGGPKPGLNAPTATGYYDRSAAGTYAYQNAWGHSPVYRNWHPNDCTNFVSQSLRAGGWQYRQDPFWDWFYVDSGGQSNSWVNAYVLRNFTANSGRASFLAYFEDLFTGDVIFADWGYNGPGVDHSIIVDSATCYCLSGIFVSYHDKDNQHRSLADLLFYNPTSSNTYWAYTITGSQ